MATCSSILALKIPWGHKELNMTEQLSTHKNKPKRIQQNVSNSATLWTVAYQAPQSMEYFSQHTGAGVISFSRGSF